MGGTALEIVKDSVRDIADDISERPIRWALVLALLPIPLFAYASWGKPKSKSPVPSDTYLARLAPQPLMPRAVATEGIREQRKDRLDDGSFQRRWDMIERMPPMTVHQARKVSEVRRADAELATAHVAPGAATRPPAPPRRGHLRSRPARLDVCARHGMHKQFYNRGRWPSWRCRR